MAKLVEHFPRNYRNSNTVLDFTYPLDLEYQTLIYKIEEMKKQFSVDTATYSLSQYEEEYGLPINPAGITIDERRSRIKAKMRSIGTVTKELIETVVESWSNADVEIIEDSNNFKVIVKFINKIGIPSNMQDVYNTVNEIKPAHLVFEYQFKYRRHEELRNRTHQSLRPFTHQEINERGSL